MDSEESVRAIWASISDGDLRELEAVLAPDAAWRAVEDGPWNCQGRSMILDVIGQQVHQGLAGEIDSVSEVGDRIVVGFRPRDPRPGGWPLDDGVRYLVLTLREGLVVEMKGCLDRRAANDYARQS